MAGVPSGHFKETSPAVLKSGEIGPCRLVPPRTSLIGFIYYGVNNRPQFFEYNAGLWYDLMGFELGVSGYYRAGHDLSWWIRFDISKEIEFGNGMKLVPGWAFFYLIGEDNRAYFDPDDPDDNFSGWYTSELTARLHIPVWKYQKQKLELVPVVGYSFPLTDNASDLVKIRSVGNDSSFVYGGLTFSLSF